MHYIVYYLSNLSSFQHFGCLCDKARNFIFEGLQFGDGLLRHESFTSCRRPNQMRYRKTDKCSFCDLPQDIRHILLSVHEVYI